MSIIIAFSRFALPIIALMIMTKCILTLLLGHPVNKTYGYIVDAVTDEKIPLNTWETSLGRSNSCDITVAYDTVSRFQAVISRRIDGWYIFDTRSRSGTKVNGKKVDMRAIIKDGDKITLGDKSFQFIVADDPVQQVGKNKKNKGAAQQAPQPRPAMPRTAPPPAAAQRQQPQQVQQPVRPPMYGAAPPATAKPANLPDFSDTDFSLDFGKKTTAQQEPAARKTLYTDSLRKGQNIYAEDESYFKPAANDKALFSDSPVSQPIPPVTAAPKKSQPPVQKEAALINSDTGEVFVLCGNEVVIGRGRAADISINDVTVSRRHALLTLYDDGWAVSDAGSKGGTRLNSKRITSPQLLFDGDIIGISEFRLDFVSDYKSSHGTVK